MPKDMTTTQTERWLDALEKDQQILGEKLNGIQAGLKDVLDQILRLTEMVAAIQVSTMSEVSQETSTDFFVIPIRKKQRVIKKVDEFKDQATEVSDIDTEGEVVIFKLQPQVSVEQQHKLVCGNQQVLTDIPPHLDFDEDEDDFIVLEGRALE
ncbi:BnaC04g26300D [Brassica napus]|uniref:Uncharacterized protein n=3 Tax=Brassica TaxID=3705 RepID=A0ABQ7DZS9_BRACR|nr:hypothetical protein DY000_02032721 [Brassica cretica]CAF1852890.1 unnamed protein product [Brassica napus]CDY13205.1 BnaC04g26300D [Brassica napus]